MNGLINYLPEWRRAYKAEYARRRAEQKAIAARDKAKTAQEQNDFDAPVKYEMLYGDEMGANKWFFEQVEKDIKGSRKNKPKR